MKDPVVRWICDRCQYEIERPYDSPLVVDAESPPGWGRVHVFHRLTNSPRHLPTKDLCSGCVRTVLNLLGDGGPS